MPINSEVGKKVEYSVIDPPLQSDTEEQFCFKRIQKGYRGHSLFYNGCFQFRKKVVKLGEKRGSLGIFVRNICPKLWEISIFCANVNVRNSNVKTILVINVLGVIHYCSSTRWIIFRKKSLFGQN